MPNWCNDHLEVTGTKDDIAAFLAADIFHDDRESLDFEKIDPTPMELRPPASDGWYNWRCEHWGTKWNLDARAGNRTVSLSGDTVGFSFETAWAPPCALVKTLSRKFPALTFVLRYLEPGMNFAGEAAFKDGCGGDTTFDGGMSDPDFARLVEFFGVEEWYEEEGEDDEEEGEDDEEDADGN